MMIWLRLTLLQGKGLVLTRVLKLQTYGWKKYGYFQQQPYQLRVEKHISAMTILYLNQVYSSYKDKKKIYYCDFFVIGQIIPALNSPENLTEYEFKSNETKIFRPKYDVVSGQFLGLIETRGYLTDCEDKSEFFLDYGYSKINSKILYGTRKKIIPNSFSGRFLEIISCNMRQVLFWTVSFLTFSCSCHRPQTELKQIINIRIQLNYDLSTLIPVNLVKTLTLQSSILKIRIVKKQRSPCLKFSDK